MILAAKSKELKNSFASERKLIGILSGRIAKALKRVLGAMKTPDSAYAAGIFNSEHHHFNSSHLPRSTMVRALCWHFTHL